MLYNCHWIITIISFLFNDNIIAANDIDFNSDTESFDSNGLDDIGKSIVNTLMEQELGNDDSNDIEDKSRDQKYLLHSAKNSQAGMSVSPKAFKSKKSATPIKIYFPKHSDDAQYSASDEEDSYHSDSTYNIVTKVVTSKDNLLSRKSSDDNRLDISGSEFDNMLPTKLEILKNSEKKELKSRVSAKYDDRIRKLDDVHALDEYYSLLSSQNDSDLILQSSLSSHSLTPESSENNSLSEKIETAINFQT